MDIIYFGDYCNGIESDAIGKHDLELLKETVIIHSFLVFSFFVSRILFLSLRLLSGIGKY